jgi:hypothetical protein
MIWVGVNIVCGPCGGAGPDYGGGGGGGPPDGLVVIAGSNLFVKALCRRV